jgi:hypothetical protein
LQIVIATFNSNVTRAIEGEDVNFSIFDVCVDLIQAAFTKCLDEPQFNESVLPDIFLYSYLIPISTAVDGTEDNLTSSQAAGRSLWQEWLKGTSEGFKVQIVDIIKNRLKVVMEDTKAQPTYAVDIFLFSQYVNFNQRIGQKTSYT